MKRIIIFLLLLQSIFIPNVAAAERFADVKPGSWAEESIYFLSERGSIAGTGNGLFSPNEKISRAQAVAILVRELYGNAQATKDPGFMDVGKSHYFYKDIAVATEKGLLAGFPDKTFRPSAILSRGETVAILERAYKIQNGQHPFHFKDVAETNWALPSIAALASNNLIGGYEDGTFRPSKPVTRAEFAVFLTRVINFDADTVKATFRGTTDNSPETVTLSIDGKEQPFRLLGVKANGGSLSLLQQLVGKQVTVVPDGENAGYLSYGGELVNAALIGAGCAALDPTYPQTGKYREELQAAAKTPGSCANPDVKALVASMTLEEKVGQLLMPMLRNWNGHSSTAVHQDTIDMLVKHHVGGVILFEKDMVSPEQIVKLNHEMQQYAKLPLFISTDQEGGSVKRMPGGTNMPGNMALGATGNPKLAYEAGRVMGTELDALGINMNFAPSLDVNINPKNPIIGLRSFSENPQVVSDFGVQLIRGLHAANMIASAKHFPGHGDTSIDTHLGLPELAHDRERLYAVELKPFRSAIAEGVDMVMTAHITFPAIDNTTVISKKDGTRIHVPATLSRKVLTGLLREEMGFDGLIVTDAFTMKAITDHFGEQEAAVGAIKAGADIVLMPQQVGKTAAAIVNAVKSGEISEQQVNQSVERIIKLKMKYQLFEQKTWLKDELDGVRKIVGKPEHRQIEQTIADQAVKIEKTALAQAISGAKSIAVAAPTKAQVDKLVGAAKRQTAGKAITIQGYTYDQLTKETNYKTADYLILGTYFHRNRVPASVLEQVQTLVTKANSDKKGYVVFSMGDPYEKRTLKSVNHYMAVYGDDEPNVKAGVAALFK